MWFYDMTADEIILRWYEQMNEIQKSENTDIMDKYHRTENILDDIQNIIDVSQKEAYRSINTILTQRNWLIGYRIAEEELAGENRAEYGASIIKKLSKELSAIKVLRNPIFTASMRFIKHILRFSKHCLENLKSVCLGHITLYCQRFLIRRQETGMNAKLFRKHGASVHYSAM